jgi:hypothetical protein
MEYDGLPRTDDGSRLPLIEMTRQFEIDILTRMTHDKNLKGVARSLNVGRARQM